MHTRVSVRQRRAVVGQSRGKVGSKLRKLAAHVWHVLQPSLRTRFLIHFCELVKRS